MRRAVSRPATIAVAAVLHACATASPTPVSGETAFQTHCVSCHGPRGAGDGPDAVSLGLSMPDLRTLRQRHGGQFPADAIAQTIDGRALPAAHVRRDMPVWGDVFEVTARVFEDAPSPQDRIDALVSYLRELQLP